MVAGLGDFGQKQMQVFAVDGVGCGGSEGEVAGGLGRWWLGEFY